jgi:hypothetical protein
LIFWSKTPDLHTKEGRREANKERDKRVRAHQLHMNAANAATENNQSQGYDSSMASDEGLNEDLLSKAGQVAQDVRSMSFERSKTLVKMRSRIRARRQRVRSKGKSKGF